MLRVVRRKERRASSRKADWRSSTSRRVQVVLWGPNRATRNSVAALLKGMMGWSRQKDTVEGRVKFAFVESL